MRARTLLRAEEEKKLLRRIDWHIMVSSDEYKPCYEIKSIL
jgi:hypothetical protein